MQKKTTFTRSFRLLLTLLAVPVLGWSQSTLNFPVYPDAGPAGLAVVNPGTAAASVTVSAYSATGTLLASPVLTVPAGGQIAKLTTELFPTAVNSRGGLQGWIQVTSATTALQGFMIMGDFISLVSGMGIATPSSDQILPVSGGTLVGAANPGTSSASITIKAYDANGAQVGATLTRTLPAKGWYDSEINDNIIYGTNEFGVEIPGSEQFASVRHVRITSTVPVAAGAALFLTKDRKDASAMTGTDHSAK